jgi:hypothetical protein
MTKQIRLDGAICVDAFLSEKIEKLARNYIIVDLIRQYKSLVLYSSYPINIYWDFMGKLVQHIAVLSASGCHTSQQIAKYNLLYCHI